MHLLLTFVAATYLAFGSVDASAVTIKYYCKGDANHKEVPNICKNTCWAQNCMKIGTQFTFNRDAQNQNRHLSGNVVPSAANSPCGAPSGFGDAILEEIDEFPIASSNNPTGQYSLRCAGKTEQRVQGGLITSSGAQNGDVITFELIDADKLDVDWCDPASKCENDHKQFQLQGNNYVESSAVSSDDSDESDDSDLSSLGSTPSPPRKRDTTPWVRSLARTVRIHARAWPSRGMYELIGIE